MAKISSYTELTRVDPKAFMVLARQGRNYKRSLQDMFLDIILDRFTGSSYKLEMWNANAFPYPWRMDAVGTGTITSQATVANHPGINRIASVAAVNTGYAIWMGNASDILIAGEEYTELIFNVVTSTAFVMRFGFGDNFNNAAAPTDGIWIDVAGTTLSGKTRNNATESTTGTTVAISTGTWYRARIVVNADASRVDFYLFDCATGAQLWTNNLTTNIPKTAGRETSHGMHAYRTTAVASNILDVDYMSVRLPKVLGR